MRNTVLFLVIGTLVTIALIAVCTTVCAAVIIILAKLIHTGILVALPFSIIGGMVLSFFLYGKIIRIIMNKCGLENRKKYSAVQRFNYSRCRASRDSIHCMFMFYIRRAASGSFRKTDKAVCLSC